MTLREGASIFGLALLILGRLALLFLGRLSFLLLGRLALLFLGRLTLLLLGRLSLFLLLGGSSLSAPGSLLGGRTALFGSALGYTILGLVMPVYGMVVTEPKPTEISSLIAYWLFVPVAVLTMPFAFFAGPIGLGLGVGSLVTSLGSMGMEPGTQDI